MRIEFPEQNKDSYAFSQDSLFYRYGNDGKWHFIHTYDCVLSAIKGRDNHFYKQKIKGFPHGKPQYRIMQICASVDFETLDGEE